MSAQPASGTNTIFCFGAESGGYGAGVLADIDRALVVNTGESLALDPIILTPDDALTGGADNLDPGSAQVVTGRQAKGSFSMYVPTQGLGLLLLNALGVQRSYTSLGGSPAAYSGIFDLGPIWDLSLIVQKQVYTAGGTLLKTITQLGVKITAVTFRLDPRGYLRAEFETDSQDEVSDIAAASVGVTQPWRVFHFQQFDISLDSSPLATIESFEMKVERPQGVEDFFAGGGGKKDQPVAFTPKVTGTINQGRIVDDALYDLFAAQTPVPLSIPFTGGVISGANHESLTLDVPQVFLRGKTITVDSKETLKRAIPFEGKRNDAGDPGVTATYVTKDAAA